MHFTFSDTIAGSVVALHGGRGRVHAADDRRPRVRRRSSRRRRFAEVMRNLGEAYVDATGQMRDMLDRGRMPVRLRDLLPRGRRARSSRRSASSSSAARRTTSSSSARTGGSIRSARSPTSTCGRSSPTATSTTPSTARGSRSRATSCRARRQETDTISRLVYGMATAYLLTGEDRFLEAAETRHRVPARAHAHRRRRRGHRVLGTTASTRRGDKREEDPRLRVRRRLRRDPGLRADLRARRPDPDVPRHRRPADPERHRA